MEGLEIQEVPEDNTRAFGSPEDGAEFFVHRMFSEHPEWTILALEGSAADMVTTVAEYLGADSYVVDATEEAPESARFEHYLLQLEGHPWSLLLQLERDYEPLRLWGEELSKKLDVRAVAFGYEETGGSSVAQLYESGQATKSAKTSRGWPAFFRRLNLFIPMYFFCSENGRTQLVLEGVERSQVASLSFFSLSSQPPTRKKTGRSTGKKTGKKTGGSLFQQLVLKTAAELEEKE